MNSGVGGSGVGEQVRLNSKGVPFVLGVHENVAGTKFVRRSSEGVMMSVGVSGKIELSSDKRESAELFLSPQANISSHVFPSTQLVLSQRGQDCYSIADEVVSH